jgi:hypothetical protein
MFRITAIALSLVVAAIAASTAARAATVFIENLPSATASIGVTVYLPGGPAYLSYDPGAYGTFTFEPGGVYYIELGPTPGTKPYIKNVSGIDTEEVVVTPAGATPILLTVGQTYSSRPVFGDSPGIGLTRASHGGDMPSKAEEDEAADLKKQADENYKETE